MYLKWSENPRYNRTVQEIQKMLNRAYANTSFELRRNFSWPWLQEDGYFGKATAAAVWAFQKTRKNPLNAPEYGVVGDDTWRALTNFYDGPLITSASERTLMDKFRTQCMIWKMEYPESCKNNYINTLKDILDAINIDRIKECISKKQWTELTNRINTTLCNNEMAHNSRLRELDKELKENNRRHNDAVKAQKELVEAKNSIPSKEYKEAKRKIRKERTDSNEFRNKNSAEAQSIRKTIKAKYDLTPQRLFEKIEKVTNKCSKISKGLSFVEVAGYSWKLFLQFSIPIENRDEKWKSETNHVLGQLLDSIINIVVGRILGLMVTAIVGATVLTGGWAIAAVLLIGAIITFIIDYIFNLIDSHLFNESNLTGLERIQKYQQSNTKIYVDWAQTQTYTV